MTAPPGRPEPAAGLPDALLAVRAATGDQVALGEIFDRYAPRLLAFCISMLGRRADAEDCLQDVFVLAATRLSGLREPDRLRSWLFAVARHECLARIKRNGRELPVDTIPDRPTHEADQPAERALDRELAELLAAAVAGLPERDRVALELADRQGLATDEVAKVLGLSAPSAYKVLTRAREVARRSLGALVVARTGRDACTQLDLVLTGWDGRLTPLMRKRIARHIDDCATCSTRERRLVTPAAFLAAAGPALVVPVALRSTILAAAARAQARGPAGSSAASGRAGGREWRHGWPAGTGAARRVGPAAWVLAAALVIAVLAAALIGHERAARTVTGQPVPVDKAAGPSTAAPPSGRPSPPGPTATSPAGHPAPPPDTATRPRSSAASRGVAPPEIDSVTVQCRSANPTAAAGGGVPVLTWVTRHDTGVTLAVSVPGAVGPTTYGSYGPTGSADLPRAGCIPSAGPQTYRLTTTGGTGPAASRTIRWTPPTAGSTAPPSSSAPAAPSSTSSSSTGVP